MKLNKTFFIWLFLVVLWNFGFPGARPIYDVVAAVALSFLAKTIEGKTQ
tara:strand:+ start:1100 stop:1246 length:147 start_codon:yes stop_codon:yes gene_type:complete